MLFIDLQLRSDRQAEAVCLPGYAQALGRQERSSVGVLPVDSQAFASVFVREISNDDGKSRTVRSVNIQRRYVEGNETKYTSSFGLAELPQAIRALELATQWVEQQEASLDSEG